MPEADRSSSHSRKSKNRHRERSRHRSQDRSKDRSSNDRTSSPDDGGQKKIERDRTTRHKHKYRHKDRTNHRHKHRHHHRHQSRSRSPASSASSVSSASSDSIASRSPSPNSTTFTSRSLSLLSPSTLAAAASLISSLLAGQTADIIDTATELQFLLFRLDAGEMAYIDDMEDQRAKQLLEKLFNTLDVQKKRDSTGLYGYLHDTNHRAPLLHQLQDNFPQSQKTINKTQPMIGPIHKPQSLLPNEVVIDKSSPSNSAEKQLNGDDDDDVDDYGPQPLSSLSAAELQALNQLREARQQAAETQEIIAQIKQKNSHQLHSSSDRDSQHQHEEWMISLPSSGKKNHQDELGSLMNSSDTSKMTGKSFSMKPAAVKSNNAADSADNNWTDSPLDRQLKQMQKEADNATQRAVAMALKVRESAKEKIQPHRTEETHPALQKANSSAQAAQLDHDKRVAASGSTTNAAGPPSLIQLHQERLARESASATRDRGAPIFWDRDKDMGLRRQKNAGAIQSEIRSASGLSSRFQTSE